LPAGQLTVCGGVLYLINLMRALDIPASYEPGWALASSLSPWAVLELLGRALLGPAGAAVADDPLWPALAALDGRPAGELPGADYRRPALAFSPCLPFSLSPCPLLANINPALLEWLAEALPPIQARLLAALHLDDPAALPAALLLVSARLFVTASHVDLVLALDAASLAVRRAGLDLNPGWLPRFGRVITFHFE
jgi:hypothetical protein